MEKQAIDKEREERFFSAEKCLLQLIMEVNIDVCFLHA